MSRPRPQTVAGQDGPQTGAGRAEASDGGPRRPLARGTQGPHRAPDPREPRGPHEGDGGPTVRLTGRGAILALLVLSFLGLIVSDWLGWGVLANVTFVAACTVIACYAKPGDLLAVTVCPPLAFFVACVCAKLATSAGATSAAEGTLVTLANSAPWLFLGTVVTILIGLRRGLLGNIRDLREGLHGEPDGPSPDRGRRAVGDGPGGAPGPPGPLGRGPGGPAWRA